MQQLRNKKYRCNALYQYQEHANQKGIRFFRSHHLYIIQQRGERSLNIFSTVQSIQPLIYPTALIICKGCNEDITSLSSIYSKQTEQCCVKCFCRLPLSSIANAFYFVRSSMINLTLTQPNWNIRHQILLLEALYKLNYGNWEQISDYISQFGAQFQHQQIQRHYNKFYLSKKNYKPILSQCVRQFMTQILHEQEKQKQQSKFKNTFLYNQIRNQFMYQYDNDAEQIIQHLQYDQNQPKQLIQIKTNLVAKYRKKVQYRNRMREFVLEHKLLDAQYNRQKLKESNQFIKSAQDTLKPFMRFMNRNQYQMFVNNIAQSQKLKSIAYGLMKTLKQHNSINELSKNYLDNESKNQNLIHQFNIKYGGDLSNIGNTIILQNKLFKVVTIK